MNKRAMSENQRFSLVKRAESFTHAGRGIRIFMRSTHNAWIHTAAFLFVLYLGWHFHITQTEWLFLIIASGLVFITEAVNTAIEIDIDLTSPDEHPYARDTKDVAAGAVLISVLVASTIGVIIFLPYIFAV